MQPLFELEPATEAIRYNGSVFLSQKLVKKRLPYLKRVFIKKIFEPHVAAHTATIHDTADPDDIGTGDGFDQFIIGLSDILFSLMAGGIIGHGKIQPGLVYN